MTCSSPKACRTRENPSNRTANHTRPAITTKHLRTQSVEWDETVHPDNGLLGFTTEHIYFYGPNKKFRVRYDRIVDFETFADGFAVMRNAQTAEPGSIRTGDDWFAYNLAAVLAQMELSPSACNPGNLEVRQFLHN